MVSAQPVEHLPKPSFAKVAASRYPTSSLQKVATDPKAHEQISRSSMALQSVSDTALAVEANEPSDMSSTPGAHNNLASAESLAAQTSRLDTQVIIPDSALHGNSTMEGVKDVSPKAGTSEDSNTQLSSSDSSAKLTNLDVKSVASGTTFALDEKESLRPDDSASTRAVEDDDSLSPAENAATGSRVGSETDGRAFRHQLHEISAIDPSAQRGSLAVPWQHPASQNGRVSFVTSCIPTSNGTMPMTDELTNGYVAHVKTPVPDEKLLEALESPRDRVFVLKLEKEVIDFLSNSREPALELPQSNSFHRMLAHRLADYYLLGHTVDNTMGAVRLHKTPFCRMPPPVGTLSRPQIPAQTPAPIGPTRKIMRREDVLQASGSPGDAGVNTGTASKTTSETGGDSSSDGGHLPSNEPRTKVALTREEREAKYNEARLRIFGDAKETEPYENGSDEKDVSRSSSTSGKKKGRKQRSYNDDDFEARSQYNAYYPSPLGLGGYPAEAAYYGPYQGLAPTSPLAAAPQNYPPQSYSASGFPSLNQADPSSHMLLQSQNFSSGVAAGGAVAFAAHQQPGYDLSADFQRGMQSFQTSTMAPQGFTGLPPQHASMFTDNFALSTQPMSQPYVPVSATMSYQYPQSHMAVSKFSDHRQSSGSTRLQSPQHFGQIPGYGHQNQNPHRNHYPHPGTFGHPQFNPQSQAFVPTGQSFQPAPQPAYATPPVFNGGAHGQRTSPSHRQMLSNPSGLIYGSSRVSQSPVAVPRTSAAGVSHPLPQPVVASTPNQSSIAKWGTPAHLPPKPPPPASMQPSAIEAQRVMSSFPHSAFGHYPPVGNSNPPMTHGATGIPNGRNMG